MKIFLSAIDPYTLAELIRRKKQLKWNLLSYYQIRNDINLFKNCLSVSELMEIDSGAHSFQKGKKVDWEDYTRKYADFIQKYDNPKIIGFFEMDVDNIIGYENVLKLRRILERVSDKIIPVWHKQRGIKEFTRMCEEYSGRIVAITGFSNEDIRDDQYVMFLKEAKKHHCKVHCLGMTRKRILDKVPFDFTDSATWKLRTTYGHVEGIKDKKIKKGLKVKDGWEKIWAYSYLKGMEMQEHYYQRWKRYCKD